MNNQELRDIIAEAIDSKSNTPIDDAVNKINGLISEEKTMLRDTLNKNSGIAKENTILYQANLELRHFAQEMIREASDLMDFCVDRRHLDPEDDSIDGIKTFNKAKEDALNYLHNKITEIKYKHEKTGNVYTFVSNGLVSVNGVWEDSISYKNEKGMFTRTFADFHAKFTLIQ